MKNKKKWFYCTLAIALLISITATCNKNAQKIVLNGTGTTEKVLNGTEAKIEDFPFVGHMGTCTGSIIGKKWVLFAAHCGDQSQITIGSEAPCASGGKSYKIKKNYIYPFYNSIPGGIHQTDVKLAELEQEIDFSNTTAPILFQKEDGLKIGSSVLVAGWAKGNGNPSLAGQPGGETGGCGRFEALAGPINQFFGSAQTSFNISYGTVAGTRSGDSGGPAFIQKDKEKSYLQVGINSTTGGSSNQEARVSSFYDWISQTSGIQEAMIKLEKTAFIVDTKNTGLPGFQSVQVVLKNDKDQEIDTLVGTKTGDIVSVQLKQENMQYLLNNTTKNFVIDFQFYYGGTYFNKITQSFNFEDIRKNIDFLIQYPSLFKKEANYKTERVSEQIDDLTSSSYYTYFYIEFKHLIPNVESYIFRTKQGNMTYNVTQNTKVIWKSFDLKYDLIDIQAIDQNAKILFTIQP